MFEQIKHIEIIIFHSMILFITITDSIMDIIVYQSFMSFGFNIVLAITILVSLAFEFRHLRRQSILFIMLMARFIVSILYYGPQAIWILILSFRVLQPNWIFHQSINIIQMIFLILQYQSQVETKYYHILINYGTLIIGEALAQFYNQSPLVLIVEKLIRQKFDENICYAYSKDLKELTLNFLNTFKKHSKTFPTSHTENTYILTPKANSNMFFLSHNQNYELAQIAVYQQYNEFIQPLMEGGNCQQKTKIIVKSLQELMELRKSDENLSQQLIVATMIDQENNLKLRYTITISEINQIFLMQLIKLNSNSSLRENQKIAKFKQRLVNIFQHKLKTPLNSAIGHLLTAKDDKEIPKEVKQQYLQPALLNCTLQIYQVQDILDYLSSEVDQLVIMAQKVDLLKLAQDVFQLIEFQCKMKEINVIFKINNVDLSNHSEKINIYTDENKLTRVLLNLLNNSYRYAAENGWIILEIKTNHLKRSTLFTIRDSGEGMPKEDIQSLNLQLIDFSNKNLAIIKKNKYKEVDSKVGISLLVTNKLIRLLSGDSSLLKAKRDKDGGMEFTFSINDTSEVLSECSLEVKKKNSFAKQQSLRQLTKSQNQSSQKSSQFYISQRNSGTLLQKSPNIFIKKKSIENENEEIDEEPSAQVILSRVKPQINRLKKSKQTIHQCYLKQKRLFNISSLKQIAKIKQQQIQSFQQEIYQLPQQQESQYILIVDDEPFNIDSISMMLKKLGYYRYLKAFNGQQCIEIVESYNDQIFAIFMDIDMPIMNGIQASKILVDLMNQSKIECIPIIGCTAHEDCETHIKCFDAGMIHIVVKPIFLKSILEAFQKIKEFFQETNVVEGIQRSNSHNSK